MEITGSYGHSLFNFLKNHHPVFHSSCTTVHCHEQSLDFPCQHLLFPLSFFFSLTFGRHGGYKMVFQGNFDLGIHIFFQNMKGRCGSLPYIISCILLYSATSTLLWPYSCLSIISYLWLAYKLLGGRGPGLNTTCYIHEGQAYSRCLLVSYKLNSLLNILPAAFYSLSPFLGHYYLNYFSCPASPYLLLNCCLCLQFSVESFLFSFCLF